MNLLPSPDQTQIVDTLRGFLASAAPVDRLRFDGPVGNRDHLLWPRLGELGFIGLALDETEGGVGLEAAEEMLVCRELGRSLVSIEILGLMLGARVARKERDPVFRDACLAGRARVGLGNTRADISVGSRISGEFHLFEAQHADWVLLILKEGAAMFMREDFASLEPVAAMDATLSLERAALDDAEPRLWIPATEESIYDRAILLMAAYAVGVGEGARDMAVDYAKVREQFGKQIGSFQAIKHICADMAIRSEAALAQTSFASLLLAQGHPDSAFHSVASKIVATDTALKNAAANIQVHGAFGFTAEANAHHYLKRAHVADRLWGSLNEQRERLLSFPTPA